MKKSLFFAMSLLVAAVTFVILAMPPMKKALNYIKQMAYKQ